MTDADRIVSLITGFVAKSGGIEKVEQAITAMKGVQERGDFTGFVQRLGKRPDGAQQFFAAALMGFTLAAMVSRAEKAKTERN